MALLLPVKNRSKDQICKHRIYTSDQRFRSAMCEVVIYTTGKSLNWLWKCTLKVQSAGTTAGSIWPTFPCHLGSTAAPQTRFWGNETENSHRVPTKDAGNMVVSAIIRAIQGTYRQCICCTGTPLLHENHILTLGDLKEIGREVREILSDALARHPASSGAHLYTYQELWVEEGWSL